MIGKYKRNSFGDEPPRNVWARSEQAHYSASHALCLLCARRHSKETANMTSVIRGRFLLRIRDRKYPEATEKIQSGEKEIVWALIALET